MRPSRVGHFRTRLHETEDVVDEEEHVLVLDVAEVLGHGQRRQGHAQTHAGRLVHLAVDQGGLVDDARLRHLDPQVVALAGALTHAGEHGHAAVLLGHTMDHLLDDDRLAHAGSAEQTDLASLHVGLEQVDDLDAGLEHLGSRFQVIEGGGVGGSPSSRRLLDRVGVERVPRHVEHVTQDGIADRDGDAPAQVGDRRSPDQSVGLLEADAAHPALSDLLGDFRRDSVRLTVEVDGRSPRHD